MNISASLSSEGDLLSSIHKALIGFDKRAERSSEEILEATFVDSAPLFDLLATTNNQIIYGRRGTGKTHALKYLGRHVERSGAHPIYMDLRSVGSNGSIYNDAGRPLAERASNLILDVLGALLNECYSVSINALETALDPAQITMRLDDFSAAIQNVRINGNVELETHSEGTTSTEKSATFKGILSAEPSAEGGFGLSSKHASGVSEKRKLSGSETVNLNFGNIAASLSGLISVLGVSRLWLLIDEWSEVPVELQPYLADLLRRTIIPTNQITVKIAAIEHRSQFSILLERGEYIGLELGADLAADLNLDDFLVFDNNHSKATNFFKTLLFRHYANSGKAAPEVDSAERFIQIAFTQWPVFEEFVRAVEGVPRDALNLAAKIATKAYGDKIAMQHVRNAARDWYQQDKQAVIRGNRELDALLTKVIDDIIGIRKARAFLFPSNTRNSRIEQLFDARLLHILKKNVSSHDDPGVRYDVYKIDYGCYVDLINTTKAPLGLFEAENDEFADAFIEVPRDDYRSIRRAILRPSDLETPF